MKIAVFGRENTVTRVMSLYNELSDLELVPLIYNDVTETPKLIERAFNCDVYLFTDELAYLAAKELIDIKRLPTVEVKIDSFTIAATLYRELINNRQPFNKIGIDLVHDEDINEILAELGMTENHVHLFTHVNTVQQSSSELIQYYEELANKQEIDCVFTVSEDVFTALRSKDIPVKLFEIPTLHLKNALQEAISLRTLQHSSQNLLVTGILTIGSSDASATSPHLLTEKTRRQIRSLLLSFTEQTKSSLFEDDQQRFILTGTDQLLKHLRSHYREFPLLQSLMQTIDEPTYLAFGLGLHAKEASKHAEMALNYCEKSDYSICYIVNEREDTIGPIGIKKEIDTSRLYQALIHRAKLNNELAYNFIHFIKERNQESFSTNDVALFYNVTKRSAERTINKLLAGEVIYVSGEERPYTKGRPRKLFRLKQ